MIDINKINIAPKCTRMCIYSIADTGKTLLAAATYLKFAYVFCGDIEIYLKAEASTKLGKMNGFFANPKNNEDLKEIVQQIVDQGIEYVIIEGVDLLADMLVADTNANSPNLATMHGGVSIKGHQKVNHEFETFVKDISAKRAVKRILFIAHEDDKNEKISPAIGGKIYKYTINHACVAVGRMSRVYDDKETHSVIDFNGGYNFMAKHTGDLSTVKVPFADNEGYMGTIDDIFSRLEETIFKESAGALEIEKKEQKEKDRFDNITDYRILIKPENWENEGSEAKLGEIFRSLSPKKKGEMIKDIRANHSDFELIMSSIINNNPQNKNNSDVLDKPQ